MSAVPSPAIWYAILTPPLRAYLICGGTLRTAYDAKKPPRPEALSAAPVRSHSGTLARATDGVTCGEGMRAAGITTLGEPVEIIEVDEPATPAPAEVLIDVVAAGIGNWDELVRTGSWQIGGPAPMALGTEAAGTVAAVGSAVTGLSEGDEVMTHPLPLRRHGTWAGRVLAPAATVAPRPPAASWEASGAFPIPALTAAQALDEALAIESGGWLVVNGAGGVTGGLLVQLAA